MWASVIMNIHIRFFWQRTKSQGRLQRIHAARVATLSFEDFDFISLNIEQLQKPSLVPQSARIFPKSATKARTRPNLQSKVSKHLPSQVLHNFSVASQAPVRTLSCPQSASRWATGSSCLLRPQKLTASPSFMSATYDENDPSLALFKKHEFHWNTEM